jgi:hypothetical protein
MYLRFESNPAFSRIVLVNLFRVRERGIIRFSFLGFYFFYFCNLLLYSQSFIRVSQADYISLTSIARHRNPEEPKDFVKNWMGSKTTI